MQRVGSGTPYERGKKGEKMKKVYLAGKITGDRLYRQKFKQYQKRLEKKGYIVVNPAVLPSGLSNADYMRICFSMIDSVDKVFFMPDYEESNGARLEMCYSLYIEKETEVIDWGSLA